MAWPVCYGASVFFPNKTDRHDITEILLKVALHDIKQTNSKCTSSPCTFGSFKLFLETIFFSMFLRDILLTGNTKLGINSWINIRIMFDGKNIYFSSQIFIF